MHFTENFRREYHPTNAEIAADDLEGERGEAVSAALRDIRERAIALYMAAQAYGAENLIDEAILEAAECLAIECGGL